MGVERVTAVRAGRGRFGELHRGHHCRLTILSVTSSESC